MKFSEPGTRSSPREKSTTTNVPILDAILPTAQKSQQIPGSSFPETPTRRKFTTQQSRGSEVPSTIPSPNRIAGVIGPGLALQTSIVSHNARKSSTTPDLTESDLNTRESLVPNYTEQTATMNLNPFQTKADQSSVATIKKSVEGLNFLIDNGILNILDVVRPMSERRLNIKKTFVAPMSASTDFMSILNESGPLEDLYKCLMNSSGISENSRDRILDLILHDKFCSLIYDAYFNGKNFWGVVKEHAEHYEKLYSFIMEQEPGAARKWRSMTVDAEFAIYKGDIESLTKKILSEFTDIITFGYSQHTSGQRQYSDNHLEATVNQVVHDHRKSIYEIVELSRNLSLQIQRDMIFSSLKVVRFDPRTARGTYRKYVKGKMISVANADVKSGREDHVLGAIKFGLNMENKEGHEKLKMLILPTVITDSDIAWARAAED